MAKFITPYVRRQRIEVLLRRKGWTWYRLAKEMRMEETSVCRSLKRNKATAGRDRFNPSLKTLKALARALDVSVGFFVDTDL